VSNNTHLVYKDTTKTRG